MSDVSPRRVLVLSTGGTIAGEAPSASATRYVPGKVGIEQLLGGLSAAPENVVITAKTIAAIGSQDMNRQIWAALHAEIVQAFAENLADGVVITHGTDTADETAFLLNLTLPHTSPVVIASAMRPANALGADGPRNLANAINIAASAESYGRGVLLVMGDTVFHASDVYKASTTSTEAFRSFPCGPAGAVTPSTLRFFAPATPSAAPAYPLPAPDAWPLVTVVFAHADMDVGIIDAILAMNVQGVVLAGVGHGNGPHPVLAQLTAAMQRGVAIVRSTRINGGAVLGVPEAHEATAGFISGDTLSPQKCRLLLQLLIANGVDDPIARQAAFVAWGG